VNSGHFAVVETTVVAATVVGAALVVAPAVLDAPPPVEDAAAPVEDAPAVEDAAFDGADVRPALEDCKEDASENVEEADGEGGKEEELDEEGLLSCGLPVLPPGDDD